jgi:DNA-binding IclR family transcriptional regulator
MLGTVARAGTVLDLFTVEAPEWGVKDVAAELGLCKSTAHMLLSSLEGIGLLEHTTTSRRYRLGWRTLTLGRTALKSSVFRGAAQREMHRVSELYGETMHLAAWDRGRATGVLRTVPRTGVRLPLDLTLAGRDVPAHVTAVGMVLLAARPEHERAQLPAATLERRTPNSIVEGDVLVTELCDIRYRGYAMDEEEAFVGVCCVGAPITVEGTVVAAVSMSARADRFACHQHEYLGAVTSAAHAISVGSARATDAAECRVTQAA